MPQSYVGSRVVGVCRQEASDRVLVVGDEVWLAKNIAAGLREGSKYAVDVVHDGHDAIQLCWINSYDLFALDLIIPKLRG